MTHAAPSNGAKAVDAIFGSAKAIAGGLIAGGITLAAVASDATSPADVTFIQWVLVGVSVLGTGFGVWAIPNKPKQIPG